MSARALSNVDRAVAVDERAAAGLSNAKEAPLVVGAVLASSWQDVARRTLTLAGEGRS